MKFSNFLFPAAMTPDLDHQVIHETLREGELCDELGMDMVWLAEHHFDGICAYVDPVTFAKGITFEHYDMPGMKREGDIHVDGDMKVAWFKDPDGNILNVVSG